MLHRVGAGSEHDGNRLRGLHHRQRHVPSEGIEQIRSEIRQFSGEIDKPFGPPLGVAVLDGNAPPLDMAELAQCTKERLQVRITLQRAEQENADAWQPCWVLRKSSGRKGYRRGDSTANQSHKVTSLHRIAPLHSATSLELQLRDKICLCASLRRRGEHVVSPARLSGTSYQV